MCEIIPESEEAAVAVLDSPVSGAALSLNSGRSLRDPDIVLISHHHRNHASHRALQQRDVIAADRELERAQVGSGLNR